MHLVFTFNTVAVTTAIDQLRFTLRGGVADNLEGDYKRQVRHIIVSGGRVSDGRFIRAGSSRGWWMSHNKGTVNDGFLPNALKRCFRLSGVLLKLCRLIIGCAIKFLSLWSFQGNCSLPEFIKVFILPFRKS